MVFWFSTVKLKGKVCFLFYFKPCFCANLGQCGVDPVNVAYFERISVSLGAVYKILAVLN